LKVIAAADDPVLAGNEAAGSYRDIGELEGLDDGLRFVGPDVDVAAVEGGENPWLDGVEVNACENMSVAIRLIWVGDVPFTRSLLAKSCLCKSSLILAPIAART